MIKYSFFNFEQLSNVKLYQTLQLRAKVFVIEQKCLFQDMDDLDQKAYHVLVEKNNKLIGDTTDGLGLVTDLLTKNVRVSKVRKEIVVGRGG